MLQLEVFDLRLTLKYSESGSVALILEWDVSAHSPGPEYCKWVNCLLFRMKVSVAASVWSSAIYYHTNSSLSSTKSSVTGDQ